MGVSRSRLFVDQHGARAHLLRAAYGARRTTSMEELEGVHRPVLQLLARAAGVKSTMKCVIITHRNGTDGGIHPRVGPKVQGVQDVGLVRESLHVLVRLELATWAVGVARTSKGR